MPLLQRLSLFLHGAAGQMTSPGQSSTSNLIDMISKDPKVQEVFMQQLPKDMQNKETLQWMLQSPQVRQQMEMMLNQKVRSCLCPVYQKNDCLLLQRHSTCAALVRHVWPHASTSTALW
jgi:hypothetical protein